MIQNTYSFGFYKIPSPKARWEQISWRQIRIAVVGVFLGLFVVNMLQMTSFATKTESEILADGDLKTLAAQLRGLEPELSRGLLAMSRIIQSQKNTTIHRYMQQDREAIRQVFVHHANSFSLLFGDGSDRLLATVSQFARQEGDRKSLLGFSQPQTYLIILQNTAEKRPNGGFFGSFIKVVVDRGIVASFDVIDSYVPQVLQPDTFIIGPEWIDNFLPEREIFFVGANKIGFTYHDGGHIKKLYERAYIGEKVRGVLFLRTDMFTKILPSLQQKFRERQFANASIDLIRGEARSGKKELYLEDFSRQLEQHAPALIKGFLQQSDTLVADHAMNLYLSDISGPLHTVLRNGNLTTRFEDDHMYFRDSNISFNKIDEFVQKTIRFYADDGSLVKETHKDIVFIGDLPPARYRITIQYDLQVPKSYEALIDGWTQQYGIRLGERERHILGLTHERSTRGVVYSSKDTMFQSLSGDIYHQAFFETPFSDNAYYKTKIKGNGGTNIVEMSFVKK